MKGGTKEKAPTRRRGKLIEVRVSVGNGLRFRYGPIKLVGLPARCSHENDNSFGRILDRHRGLGQGRRRPWPRCRIVEALAIEKSSQGASAAGRVRDDGGTS